MSEEDKEKYPPSAGGWRTGKTPAFAGRGRRLGEAWGAEFSSSELCAQVGGKSPGACWKLGILLGSELPPSARSTALAWWLPSWLPRTGSFSLPPACGCLADGLCSGWRPARCPSALGCQRMSVPGPSAAQSLRAGEQAAARQAGSLGAPSARPLSARSLGPRLDKAAAGGWFLQPLPGLGHRRASSSSPADREHLATLGPGAPAAVALGASVLPANSAGAGVELAARPEPCAAPARRRRHPTRAFAGSTKFGLLRGNFSGPTLPA